MKQKESLYPHVVMLRLPEATWQELERMSRDEDRSVSTIMRRLIRQALAAEVEVT